MAIIKNILENELKDILRHEPSKAEFKSALDYINHYVDDKFTLLDLEMTLKDWASDCLTRCEACGELYLTELLEERFVGGRLFKVCCVDCLLEIKNDYE